MASEYFPKQSGTTKQTFQLGAASAVPFTLDSSAFTNPHTWTLPDSNGTSGYVLSTDGAGNLSWAAVTAAPGGSDTQVQFNNAGVLDGIPSLTYTWSTGSTEKITLASASYPHNGNPSFNLTAGGFNQSWEGYSISGGTLFTGRNGYAYSDVGMQFYSDTYDIEFVPYYNRFRFSTFGGIGLNATGGPTRADCDFGTAGQVLTSAGSSSAAVWSTVSAGPGSSGTAYELIVAIASQTVFNTTIPTVAAAGGISYLEVYVNGLFQEEDAGQAYTVTGGNQITFNAGLNVNDRVAIYATKSSAAYEVIVATAAQTVVNTTIGTTAISGNVSYLQVYVNGLFQEEDATQAYTVTGANQITFNAGLNLNDRIVLYGY